MLLWIEEVAEVIKNVIEQVVNHDATLDWAGKRAYKFICFLHVGKAVVGPVVLEVVVDLVVQTVG